MPRMARLALPLMLAAVLALSACDTFTGSSDIAKLETRNAQLQGTIDVLGTPLATMVALQAAATQNVQLQAQLSQAENEALAAQATLTVLQLTGGGGAIQPTSIPVAVPPGDQSSGLPTPTNVPTDSGTRFTGTVTSTGRDSDDCAVDAASVFDATVDTIYVITRVNMLPTGSTLGARWTANGELYYDDVECWVPTQDWYNICAYCSIVPDAGTFETGTWSVELTLDGQMLSQVQFTVTSSDADQSATPVSGESTGSVTQ